ncbi:serpin peptidase inhibitor, clade F (alpha-2 antiplasmin, pigment epithelium derived factor), member 2b [Aplochiton taeniatus]
MVSLIEGSSEEEQDGQCKSVSRTESRDVISKAVLRLGMLLLKNLKTPEQPNVIISPLSISLALSQLALGAVNETEELLMHHLHSNTLPCYHRSLRNILFQLKKSDLQIAARIFLHQEFEPKPEFVFESKRVYKSEPVAFEGLEQVNNWVEKATNGKITEFLSTLPPNLLLMIINAIHFKGEWKARFDPRFTSRGVFYIDDKHMVDVEMMEGAKHPLSLLIDNDLEAQVARFPFKTQMSLLVVVPMSGQVNVTTLADKLNIADLYARLPRARAMQVKLPKFKLEYTQELQDALTNIGLGEIFARPNLAGIAEGPLVVSSVMHKTSMEINEEGSEAAAATSVVISRSNPSFSLNQPFFFALVHDVTQTPIFVGVITNPNPEAPIMESGGGPSNKDKEVVFASENTYDRPFGGPPK